MNDKQQIFDKYGNYDFPTEKKQDGINTATTQIEEIVKIVSMNCGECDTCKFLGKATKNIDCIDFLIANELYEQNYRKLPENAVVLTKEEYSDYLILQKNHEFIREKAKELQSDNERLYKNLGKFKDSTRKETARELFQAIEKSKYVEKFNGLSGAVKMISLSNLKKIMKDKYGVEIKE